MKRFMAICAAAMLLPAALCAQEKFFGLRLGEKVDGEMLKALVGRQGTFKGCREYRGLLGERGTAYHFAKTYYAGCVWADVDFIAASDSTLTAFEAYEQTCNCPDARFEAADRYKTLKARYDSSCGEGDETFDAEYGKFARDNGKANVECMWNMDGGCIELSNRKAEGSHQRTVRLRFTSR